LDTQISLEAELRQQLGYALSGIEGVPEIWLDALDKQDIGALEGHPLSPAQVCKIHSRRLDFCPEATFRLAREIDELRSATGGRDDLS
jgi:plasmid stability protein